MAHFDNYQSGNGNWVDANFESGTKPVDNDAIVVPAAVGNKINGADETGIDLDLLETQPGFAFDVGASGDPLIIDADKVLIAGSGTVHLKSAAANTTDWILVDSDQTPGLPALEIDGAHVTRVTVKKGRTVFVASLGSATKIAQIELSHRDNPGGDAYAVVNCSMLADTGILRQAGGTCELRGAAYPGVVVLGGVLFIENDKSTAGNTIIGGTTFTNYGLVVGGSGRVVVRSDGKITRATVMRGGVLDAYATGRAVEITIVDLYPGGIFIRNPDTFTGTINDAGGTLLAVQHASNQAPIQGA